MVGGLPASFFPAPLAAIPLSFAATQPLLLSVASLPPSLAIVTEPLSINGTIIALLESGKIAFHTEQGSIELSLAKTQGEAMGVLHAFLAQSGETSKEKSAVLQLQAGAPPTRATLVLPSLTTPLKTLTGRPEQERSIPELQAKPQTVTPLSDENFLKKGQLLTATLLPEEVTALPRQDDAEPHAPQNGATRSVAAQEIEVPRQALPSRSAPQVLSLRVEEAQTPLSNKDAFEAIVIGKSQSERTLLETRLNGVRRVLVLHNELEKPLPVGNKIVLAPAKEVPLPLTPFPVLSDKDAPPLRALLDALTQTDLPAAASFVQTRLPNPAQALAGTSLFFLSALRRGKLEEWLGEPIVSRLRQAGRKQAADAVFEVLQGITEQPPLRDPHVGEWKAYPLPLQHGTAFETLRLYVHDDRQEHAKKSADTAKTERRARFIVTMDLPRFGAMQLDGLSQSKRLDLVLRSETPLPESLRHEMQVSTSKTLEATGLAGTLTFQTGHQHWVSFSREQTPSLQERVRSV